MIHLRHKKAVKVRLPNGQVIERVPRVQPMGNFVMMTVRWNNRWYHIGTGSEYLHGFPDIFSLGTKVGEKSLKAPRDS